MSDTNTEPSIEVAAIRAQLMADLSPIDILAKAVGKNPRTIQRLIAQGKLPVVRIGNTPYVVVSKARQLLMAAPKLRHAPVRKGRPPRNAL